MSYPINGSDIPLQDNFLQDDFFLAEQPEETVVAAPGNYSDMPLRHYFFLFLLYAGTGWIYEAILYSIEQQKFINRGFLFGPYVPIYGFGAVIIMYLIVKIIGDKCRIKRVNTRPLAIFALILVIATIAELCASFIMEYAFGEILWDYSAYWGNFQGRISPQTSMTFAVFGTFFFYFVQPHVIRLANTLDVAHQRKLARALLCCLVLDFAASVATRVWFPNLVEHPGVVEHVSH